MKSMSNTPREVYNTAHPYTEMMRTYGNNVVAMGVSDHPKTDAPTATTEKEDN